MRVDASGSPTWTPAQLDIATSPSTKSRLLARKGPAFTVLTFSDDRAGTDDVFVQNVNSDGTLGPPAAGPGEVAGLTMSKDPGPFRLTLSWQPSCATGADYGVFQGTLAALHAGVYDHTPVVCTDAPPLLEESVVPSIGNRYYLVVPVNASAEGSHGTRRVGGDVLERPVGPAQCVATQTLGCP
jgi:hypothetical protein